MNMIRRLAAALALAGVSAAAVAGSGYKYLNVNELTQEHSNWCWAASSVDVLAFYGINENQCDVVNWAFGSASACGNTNFNWNSSNNSPNSLFGQAGSVQSILSAYGVGNRAYSSALSWNGVVNDINANRPFVMRWGWYGGGGHILVGYGFYDQQGTQMLGYMNPWPGEGYTWSAYSWVVNASYDHSWTHSLEMQR